MSSLLFPLVCLLSFGFIIPSHSKGIMWKNMNFLEAKPGEDVKFDCKTTAGAAHNKVSLWHTDARYGNENKLSPSKGRLIQSGSMFTLPGIILSEYGIYKCKVAKLGVETTIKEFILFLSSYEPTMEVEPLVHAIIIGGQATFTCDTTKVKPVWYKVSQNISQGYKLIRMPIEHGHEVTISSDADKYFYRSTLSFKNATKSDEGLYECKIHHKIHHKHKYTRLIVRDSQPPHNMSVSPGPYVHVSDGDSITLNCVVKGYPEPQVTWQKGGSNLTLCEPREGSGCAGSPRYFERDSNGLEIKNIHYPEDHGVFTCLARNDAGFALDVIYVNVTVAPKMGINRKKHERRNEHAVDIECNVKYSNPAPSFTWQYRLSLRKEFFSVADLSRFAINYSQKDQLTSVLHIPEKITLPPILYFRCIASNYEGHGYMNYELNETA